MQYLNPFSVEMSCSFLGVDDADKQFKWSVTLKRGNHTMVVPFGCGFAHCRRAKRVERNSIAVTREIARALKPYGTLTISDMEERIVPTEPTLATVLDCLRSDAQAGEYLIFEDFCSEFGYDADSRKAEKIWRTCQTQRGMLQKLLGQDFAAFMQQEIES
jgi:hypothetical protein